MQAARDAPRSGRDPDGFVVRFEGRILRAVTPGKSEQTRALIAAPWMKRFVADGLVPRTVEIPDPVILGRPGGWMWLEHDELPFPCYPHEITALQLWDSARLTLLLALEAVKQGWMLKDASAWNVLHAQGRAVFVDFLSFDRSLPSRSWIAYGQFVRHFLLPLLLHRKLGVTPIDVFTNHRDGITPERAHELMGGLDLASPIALELIVLPRVLARAGSRLIAAQTAGERKPKAVDAALCAHLVSNTLRRLQRILDGLRPLGSRSKSIWKGYEEERDHYSAADLAAKRDFVRDHLGAADTVLDLGCNAGEFSLLAAECGKTVVAADADHPSLSRLYDRIRGSGTKITPIQLNIGRPTPAVGWQNREVASFLERATGRFDCVLMLGLIHHLLVAERATLPMLAELLDRLNPRRVILEWVDPLDPKFQQMAGLNSGLYRDLDEKLFEKSIQKYYRLVAKLPLPRPTRTMYLWCR